MLLKSTVEENGATQVVQVPRNCAQIQHLSKSYFPRCFSLKVFWGDSLNKYTVSPSWKGDGRCFLSPSISSFLNIHGTLFAVAADLALK